MANPKNNMHLKKDLEILLVKKYENVIAMLEQEVRECAKGAIKEDRGGLTNSIYVKERTGTYTGGGVAIYVPYAKYVNDGRGPVEVKNAKSLSNFNGGAEPFRGHSPFGYPAFVAKHAKAFKGYHFVEQAMARVKNAIERGNV